MDIKCLGKDSYLVEMSHRKYWIMAPDKADARKQALRIMRLEYASELIMEDKGLDEDRAYALAEDLERQGLLDDFIGRNGNGNI